MNINNNIQWVECPRDAMQGINEFIPTSVKVAYLNQLLQLGFHTLDCGSFVSSKAIPQMADTHEVLPQLQKHNTKLLVIVANERGAKEAITHDNVDYLGFPLSISETFQQRNTNKSIEEAITELSKIKVLANEKNKEVVVYFSMAFGNPYQDPYNPDLLFDFAIKMQNLGIKIISLADTVGKATAEEVGKVYTQCSSKFKSIQWGVHLHASPTQSFEKINAAWQAGCRRFDTAMLGYGGCPMAKDELVGNIDTEVLKSFLIDQGVTLFNNELWDETKKSAKEIFST